MKKDIILHPVQSQILKSLIFKAGESFNKLNENKVSTDSFTFHLKSLVEAGLVKQERNQYFLTQTGKAMSNNYTVNATAPDPLNNVGWDFPGDYFPRKLHFRVDAIARAKEAHRKGGTNITVTSAAGKVIDWDK